MFSSFDSEDQGAKPDPASRYEPFFLNDMQQAYWFGRQAGFKGASAMQYYLEFATSDFDASRFNLALNRLVQRHDMLRAVVIGDGLQRVLEHPPTVEIRVDDLRNLSTAAQKEHCRAVAEEMWNVKADLTVWPQNDFRFSQCKGQGEGVLHCRLDMWCFDGRSVQIFFEDLAALYLDPDTALKPLTLTFRDYMTRLAKEENTEEYRNSLVYWKERMKSLPPPPQLPLNPFREEALAETDPFRTRTFRLDAGHTSRILGLCSQNGLTLACFMAAVYAEVIKLWSGQSRFTLNFPRFNRRLDWHPDVKDMIGEFASFTLLECRLDDGLSFLDHGITLQQQMWKDLEHDSVPGLRLLREWFKQTGQPEVQAMPIVFTATPDRRGSRNSLEESFAVLGTTITSRGATPQVLLDCQYGVLNGEIGVSWDSQDGMFADDVIESMFEAFCQTLRVLAEPDAWHTTGVVRAPESQLAVRRAQNNVPQVLEGGDCYRMFLNSAKRHKDKIAVVSGDERLTYGELLSLSLNVTRALVPYAVHLPAGEGFVAVLLERGCPQVLSILGALGAGLGYIPLDPDSPPERLATILEIARPCLVISDDKLASLLPANFPQARYHDLLNVGSQKEIPDSSSLGPKENALAYCIFTSGSTGTPKGVSVRHPALLNCILYGNREFEITPEDAVFGITAMHHDISLFDVYSTLTTGGKLVIPTREQALRPEVWADLVIRENITLWASVPTFMERLVEHCERSAKRLPLRKVMLGGDWVDTTLPSRLRALAPEVDFHTIGGPTETVCWNIFEKVDGPLPGWKSLPYGRPICNASYHIMNDEFTDAPDWAPGEMFCGGLALCDTASFDSEENARAFVRHPVSGELLYRTGDMGRFRPDGRIEILGRRDFQLNISGYRLDPAEVQQALLEHRDVRQAIVLGITSPETGRPVLASVVVPADSANRDRLERRLAEWCNLHLPLAMRPRHWMIMEELPITHNGKVDRKKLIALLESVKSRGREDRTPANPVEQFVADLWRDVLHRPVTGVRVSFFELGGDSLKAMQFFSRITEKLGVSLPVAQIFLTPTIEGLGEEIYNRISNTLKAAG